MWEGNLSESLGKDPVDSGLREFIAAEIPKVREKLRAASLKPSRLWDFLNSTFCLFFLSSVVLSGIVSIYRIQLQTAAEDHNAYQEAMKYATEFNYRLAKIEFHRAVIEGLEAGNRPSLAMIQIIKGQEETVDQFMRFEPSLPEFKNINMLAIAGRLKGLGINKRYDDVSKALLALEQGWDQNYGVDTKTIDTSIESLRLYKREALEEALSHGLSRSWTHYILGL
jgi:hypothetical protein